MSIPKAASRSSRCKSTRYVSPGTWRVRSAGPVPGMRPYEETPCTQPPRRAQPAPVFGVCAAFPFRDPVVGQSGCGAGLVTCAQDTVLPHWATDPLPATRASAQPCRPDHPIARCRFGLARRPAGKAGAAGAVSRGNDGCATPLTSRARQAPASAWTPRALSGRLNSHRAWRPGQAARWSRTAARSAR